MTFANFKGGVGKTSTTALTSYNFAKKGYKCLVVDFDAQANVTSLLIKTRPTTENIIDINTTLMSALNKDINLEKIIINIKPNLDLIPNTSDFGLYPRFLERNFNDDLSRITFFKKKLEDLKEKYDFIFIDVPPTLSLLNETAFFACNQIIVVLQTQEHSLSGAEVFIKYLQETLINEFKSELDILGILPVLTKRQSIVDKEILKFAIEEFGSNNMFENKINAMERIKRMDLQGITDDPKDMHDKNVHKSFAVLVDEILIRLQERGYNYGK